MRSLYVAAALLLGFSPLQAADKPNIILILADDLGLGDVGCSGGAFRTPQIDALAESGTRYAQAYSTPLCGPTRCQTLTGRYPFRTGLVDNHCPDAIAPSREVMIPTVLKQAGYATASVGKWGQMCMGPGEWGFEEYLVFARSGRYWQSQGPDYRLNGTPKKLGEHEYMPDVMHSYAVDFITRHTNQPFFLYYPMSHIHGPILRTPDSKPGAGPHQLYADNIAYMDKLVGRLIDTLVRLHLRDKTLVIFVGDNGTAKFGADTAKVNGRRLSGMKGSMLEGGSRVPFVCSWPGVTPKGKVCNDLIDVSDLMPTFADLAGATRPAGRELDGQSFAPQLRGEPGTPREWIYVQLGANWYVRNQGFKLNQDGKLFDMHDAPFAEPPATNDVEQAKLQAVLAKLHPTTPPTHSTGRRNKKH